MTLGPATLAHFTVTPASPSLAACCSTSLDFSITISGRKLTPYCWAMVISLTSARTFVAAAAAERSG